MKTYTYQKCIDAIKNDIDERALISVDIGEFYIIFTIYWKKIVSLETVKPKDKLIEKNQKALCAVDFFLSKELLDKADNPVNCACVAASKYIKEINKLIRNDQTIPLAASSPIGEKTLNKLLKG